jgi:hypothetical protein
MELEDCMLAQYQLSQQTLQKILFYFVFKSKFHAICTSPNHFLLDLILGLVVFRADFSEEYNL